MEKKKVLFISQEITPYLPDSEIARIGRELPQGIQERGKEIRTFMPKFGSINERRNQLHEVIRLSGMNLIIDDTDHPLIIKVASIQAARMQVYFIDNEDYFQRKYVLNDKNGAFFKDNDERAIFFARGVLETVQKLRWSPDIIHCHGWFTSLIPLYIKNTYKDNPLFSDTKIVYSVYNDEFVNNLDGKFKDKLILDGIPAESLKSIETPSFENLTKLAVENSDGIIFGSADLNKPVEDYATNTKKPILTYKNSDEYVDAYSSFYDELLS
ncbi:MAG: glycogen/starch synthase [Salinivirgaceae bacterium]|nr:glycogen/starch synthase [Salinivirgaceae bacterium]